MRFCGNFYFKLRFAVIQNQAVRSISKISGNFNAVCGFHMLSCVVFIRISVRSFNFCTP